MIYYFMNVTVLTSINVFNVILMLLIVEGMILDLLKNLLLRIVRLIVFLMIDAIAVVGLIKITV